MGKLPGERRTARRYDLRLPLRYRVSEKGATPVTGTGITCDLSTDGVAFRCRRSLPLGAHVELLVDWPSRQGNQFPIELQLTGFIVRTGGGRNGVRVTSRKFRVDSDTSLLATAS